MNNKPLPIPLSEQDQQSNLAVAMKLEDELKVIVPYWTKFDVTLKKCPPAIVSLFKQHANHAARALHTVKTIPEGEHTIIYNHLLQAILRCLLKAWSQNPQLLAGECKISTAIEKRSKELKYAVATLHGGVEIRGASAAYKSTWMPGDNKG